jgi:hypothetical protein
MTHSQKKNEGQSCKTFPLLQIAIIALQTISLSLHAQIGGTATYSFLELTPAAPVAALGGKVNAIRNSDPSLAFYNPALLNSAASHNLSLNFVNHLAGINFGYAACAYAHHRAGNFAAGIHYINYGKFIAADPAGIITGTFTSAEYAFNLTWSRQLAWLDSTITAGCNIKPLLSSFEQYASYGLLADIGFTYQHSNGRFTAAIVLRNIGGQLTPYTNTHREPAPIDIQIGIAQQLQHAPFRISLVAHHLEHPRLSSGQTNSNAASGQSATPQDDAKKGFDLIVDETMRHLIFGIECFPLRGLTLRGGYNYNRRQEMKLPTHAAMVGFSWGIGVHLRRFTIDYARSSWHLAGASNHFSLRINLKEKR